MPRIAALCNNGGRGITRGWRTASRVKRWTAKRWRRIVREAIRDRDGEVDRTPIRGWVD